MKKLLNKLTHGSLFMFASMALIFANMASNYCVMFINYEPEMPASMLEED